MPAWGGMTAGAAMLGQGGDHVQRGRGFVWEGGEGNFGLGLLSLCGTFTGLASYFGLFGYNGLLPELNSGDMVFGLCGLFGYRVLCAA